MKEELRAYLDELGHTCQDFGAHSAERTDYPLFAKEVTSAITSGQAEAGILICSTGVGMAITANKVRGIRAVVCSEPYSAALSRQHNNTNVLALGSRVVGPELARMIVKVWLESAFEGGRHAARLETIAQIEAERQDQIIQIDQPDTDLLSQTRKKIAETGRLVFERHLTDATCVLHSHARNVMVFVAAGQPIEPVLEATLKFGTIPITRFAPAHSEKLAEAIAEAVRGKEEAIRKYATAVIAPWHGLFVIGRDIDAAFDLTERIDTNAYCILMSRSLSADGLTGPETMRMNLSEAIRSFNDHHLNPQHRD